MTDVLTRADRAARRRRQGRRHPRRRRPRRRAGPPRPRDRLLPPVEAPPTRSAASSARTRRSAAPRRRALGRAALGDRARGDQPRPADLVGRARPHSAALRLRPRRDGAAGDDDHARHRAFARSTDDRAPDRGRRLQDAPAPQPDGDRARADAADVPASSRRSRSSGRSCSGSPEPARDGVSGRERRSAPPSEPSVAMTIETSSGGQVVDDVAAHPAPGDRERHRPA